MFIRLWLLTSLIVACHAADLFVRHGGKRTTRAERASLAKMADAADMSNAERMQLGLPLKKPAMRGSRTRALVPRASGDGTDGKSIANAIMSASQPNARRRASDQKTYIMFDSSANRLKLTTNITEAATFVVPLRPSAGKQEIQISTTGGSPLYIGTQAASSPDFVVKAVAQSDEAAPQECAVQTTMWSFTALPGSVTGSFEALGQSSTLYLYLDSNGYIAASSDSTSFPRASGISLTLSTVDSMTIGTNPVTPPPTSSTNDNAPTPANSTDTNVDPTLTAGDKALNNGVAVASAAIMKILNCFGDSYGTAECNALIKSLVPTFTPRSDSEPLDLSMIDFSALTGI